MRAELLWFVVFVVVVVIVVECYCFLIHIIVDPPQPPTPHFYFTKVVIFTFSDVSPRRNDELADRNLCCCGFRRDARPDSNFPKTALFCKMPFRRDGSLTLGALGSPWVPLGALGSALGFPWVPLGSPWVTLGSPLGLLGSPWGHLPICMC